MRLPFNINLFDDSSTDLTLDSCKIFGETRAMHTSLEIVFADVARIHSGPIPVGIGSLLNLKCIRLRYNALSGSNTAKSCSLDGYCLDHYFG